MRELTRPSRSWLRKASRLGAATLFVASTIGACLHTPPAPSPPSPSAPDEYRSTGLCCDSALRSTPHRTSGPYCLPIPEGAPISRESTYPYRVDRDGDGYDDWVDCCPDLPEDFDGFEDADGCPDCDNDGDGVLETGQLMYNPAQRDYRWAPACEADDPPVPAEPARPLEGGPLEGVPLEGGCTALSWLSATSHKTRATVRASAP